MHTLNLSRRRFTVGGAALGLSALIAPSAFAQSESGTKTITTSAGTYEIPLNPERVIAVDHRLDLEPALALGMPVIGYSLRDNLASWVPVEEGTRFIGTPPTRELILSHQPDLIFCTDIPGSEMWPIDQLKDVAPVIPVDYELNWKGNLLQIGEWLDRSDIAQAFIAEYETMIATAVNAVGEKIASSKVAAVWFDANAGHFQFLLGEGTRNVTLGGQVLADLGGTTVREDILGDYGMVSMEQILYVLADVDAVLLDLYTEEERAALAASPIWQRVPAVAAGRTYLTTGTFYGGGYSARRLVGEWTKLYDMI